MPSKIARKHSTIYHKNTQQYCAKKLNVIPGNNSVLTTNISGNDKYFDKINLRGITNPKRIKMRETMIFCSKNLRERKNFCIFAANFIESHCAREKQRISDFQRMKVWKEYSNAKSTSNY